MAELAVTDGMLPPSGLPAGECIVATLDDGSLRIDRADPRVLISAPLLAQVFVLPAPGVSLTWGQRGSSGFWTGGVLTIRGINQVVIYRIGEYVPRIHAYIAEWPD